MALSTRGKADVVLLIATIGWGATFAVVKNALDDASPAVLLGFRFSIGALATLPFACRGGLDRQSLKHGAFLGLLLWLAYITNTIGLQYTSATRSGFLTGLCVILVPIFASVLWRQRPHFAAWVGVSLAALGLLIMNAPALLRGEGEASLIGDLLTITSAFVWAFHILFTGKLAPLVKTGSAVFAQLAVVAVLSAATVPFEEVRFQPTPSLVGALLFSGLFSSALFGYMQVWGQARTPAVHAAIIFTLEPVFAAGCAWLLLGELLTPAIWWGGGLIILAVLSAELWPQLEARRAESRTPSSPPHVD